MRWVTLIQWKDELIAANANYHRRKNRPQHPQNLNFDIIHDHIPDNFLRRDIHVEGARHLLFATDIQVVLLTKAKTWYMDANFTSSDIHFTSYLQ